MSRSELPADVFVAASGSGIHLLRQAAGGGDARGGAAPPFSQLLVSHRVPVHTARWNRNNKVVASGSADGQVQLLYSNGSVMAVLPRDGSQLGAVSALTWSQGSKRLAAGTDRGVVHIFEMGGAGSKNPPVELGGHLGGVTALEYQHEDKFLAAASGSGSVVLYSDPHRAAAGGAAASAVPLRPTADTSARLCLSLAAAGDPSLAAGSAAGSVTVWDVPTQRAREDYAGQHGGAPVHAVAYVPLHPNMLYSAGGDGRVCLQDRAAGPGSAPAAISVGAPATALMVREDHSVLGVGTADGAVLLYDPRHLSQPLHRLRLEGGQPVSSLHWQHRYATLPGSSSSRHRSSSAAATSAPTSARGSHQPAAPSRLGMPPVPVAGADAASAPQPAGSNPGSRATSPPAGADAATQPRSSSSQLPTPAAASRATPAPALPQVTPLHRAAAPPSLAVTPLPGMAPPPVAASAAEVTPQQAVRAADAAALSQGLQQLSITPLAGSSCAAAAAAQQRQQAAVGPRSPLEQLAAAPVDLGITPLVPGPRPAAAALATGTAQRAAAAAAPMLHVTPLADSGAGGRGQLCISPLPGMPDSPSSAASASPQQRSVLGERNNSGQPSAAPLTGRRGGSALPQLAPPLPAAPEAEAPPALRGSPSFAENVPLPLPSPGPARARLQAPGAGACDGSDLAGSKVKAAAAATAGLSPAGSGCLQGDGQWSISATADADAEMQEAPAPVAAAAAAPLSPLEFSFAAAQRSLEQLASGADWGGGGGAAAGAGAEGGAGAGLPPGLRDDILALHFDMLSQFQAQQASMGQLVGQVLERNEALAAEVAALRKQLGTLTGRRAEFLWL